MEENGYMEKKTNKKDSILSATSDAISLVNEIKEKVNPFKIEEKNNLDS